MEIGHSTVAPRDVNRFVALATNDWIAGPTREVVEQGSSRLARYDALKLAVFSPPCLRLVHCRKKGTECGVSAKRCEPERKDASYCELFECLKRDGCWFRA